MPIEINEPKDSLIIEGDVVMTAKPIPPPAQAKTCKQCNRPTWRKTYCCVWCGYDPTALPYRAIVITLLGVIVTLFALHGI